MKKCKTCRFWSEMLAHSLGGPVEAYCLQGRGPKASQGYTSGSFACEAWKESTIGAIDSPGFDGTEYDGECGICGALDGCDCEERLACPQAGQPGHTGCGKKADGSPRWIP